jgi:hypothetical protein
MGFKDARDFDLIGEGETMCDAELVSNPGPKSHRRGRRQANRKSDQQLGGLMQPGGC